MIKNLIGLDIGSGAIKLTKLKKNRGRIELEKARSVDLKDVDSIKQGIASLLKSEKLKSPKVAISLSGQSVFTRFVKLPKISEKKIEQVVKYEAQQQIPFPIEKVIWDYQLFTNHKTSEIEVCLAAVKKEIVDDIYNELSQLKIDIVLIQPSPIALYNMLKCNEDIKDNTIVLDIGEKVTNLFITKEKRVWIRSIPIAGQEVTRAISAKMDITLDEAEELKKKEGITLVGATGDEELTPRSDSISKAINPALTDLLKEISRSINYYKSQFDKEATFQKVLLTGGSSNIRYIERYFENNLKIKTEKPNLLKKITPNKFTKAALDETEGQWAVALGLGLLAATEPAININLLSKEQKKLNKFNSKKPYIFASEITAASLFLILSFFSLSSINANRENLSLVIEEMEGLRRKSQIIDGIQSEIGSLKNRLKFLVTINRSKELWLNILAEVNSKIPKDSWLTSLKLDDQSNKAVKLEGKTIGSFEAVKNLRESLEESKYFTNVQTLRADPAPREKEEDYNIIFTMKLELAEEIPLIFNRKEMGKAK
jgi:type IV pilus assembly protein PilM